MYIVQIAQITTYFNDMTHYIFLSTDKGFCEDKSSTILWASLFFV
jgi:hypothetical protein